MDYKLVQAGPLTEPNEGLLIALNYLASLAIQSGTEKLGDKNLLVKDNILYVRYSYGHLAIKPSGATDTQKHFWVDNDLLPLPGLFSIDLEDIRSIVRHLDKFLLLAGIDTTRF